MIQTLGIQLYTIRDALGYEAQVKESLAKLKSYGYTDLHTAGFPPMTVQRFAELIREAGLRVCGTIGYEIVCGLVRPRMPRIDIGL